MIALTVKASLVNMSTVLHTVHNHAWILQYNLQMQSTLLSLATIFEIIYCIAAHHFCGYNLCSFR